MLKPFVQATLVFAVAASLATSAHAQGSGTAPADKGSTGWTGGSRDQQSQEGQNGSPNDPNKPSSVSDPAVQAARDAEAAKTQPVMAEGLDLNGQPRQFAPSKTVE